MRTVLVLESDTLRGSELVESLRGSGYLVSKCRTGTAAVSHLASSAPDAVLLDLQLADAAGLVLLRTLHRMSATPIIAYTAMPAAASAAEALDAGADDYLVGPFRMEELLARLRVVLRRSSAKPPTTIVTPDFEINQQAKLITTPTGESIHLTPTEWHMVEVLIRESPTVVTRQQMLSEVWGPSLRDRSNYLRVYMTGLRRKIEPRPSQPRYLLTAPGFGYRFVFSAITNE